MATWTHPQLGEFKFDEYFWIQSIHLPAFQIFTQPRGRIPERPGEVDLWIQACDATDIPSESVAQLSATVITNHRLLIPRITLSLFDDFVGTGPNSGMWWHGAIDELRDNAARGYYGDVKSPFTNPDSLRKLLSPPSISIRETGWHVKPWSLGGTPVAEFGFSSPIDPEHGIGVLTDGEKIVGIGYSCDASYFKGD